MLFRSAGRGEFHINTAHFAERYGLIVLIALGFLMWVAYRGASVILFAPVAALFAVVLTALCIGLFKYLLRLPIPVVAFL